MVLGCSLLLACSGEVIDDLVFMIIDDEAAAGYVANQLWTFVAGTSDLVLTTQGKETLILCSQALADFCALCEVQYQVRVVVTPEANTYSVADDTLSVCFVSQLVEGSVMMSS